MDQSRTFGFALNRLKSSPLPLYPATPPPSPKVRVEKKCEGQWGLEYPSAKHKPNDSQKRYRHGKNGTVQSSESNSASAEITEKPPEIVTPPSGQSQGTGAAGKSSAPAAVELGLVAETSRGKAV